MNRRSIGSKRQDEGKTMCILLKLFYIVAIVTAVKAIQIEMCGTKRIKRLKGQRPLTPNP